MTEAGAGTRIEARHGLLAASHLMIAALVALLVFVALPARYPPVDLPAAGLIVVSTLGGLGLWLRTGWGVIASRIASGACLLAGCIAIALLASSVAYLAALYGPVGSGGALLMAGLAALLLPYMVFVPAWQLMSARRQG